MIAKFKIPGLADETLGSLLNTRTFKQYCEMYQWNEEGRCGFCTVNPRVNRVEWENGSWRAWRNPFPQKHHRHHFVIAHRKHITGLTDLTPEDGAALFEIMGRISYEYNLKGGGVIMRFGNPWLNAGSVRHLHVDIQVPDGSGEVRVPLAKTEEDIAKKVRVVRAFEKMRRGTPFEGLSGEEQALVKDRL